jgi:hypothetical protein
VLWCPACRSEKNAPGLKAECEALPLPRNLLCFQGFSVKGITEATATASRMGDKKGAGMGFWPPAFSASRGVPNVRRVRNHANNGPLHRHALHG